MEQYIPKAAVMAEIKRRIKINKECMLGLKNLDYYQGKVDALNDTISSLDTLEVKEVDLCKEEERIWKDFNMAECRLSKNDLEKISKHFFELGMAVSNKARKGE